MKLAYAIKLAERWESDQITATEYYYRQARAALRAFRDCLSPKHHSLLVGIIEFYNYHK